MANIATLNRAGRKSGVQNRVQRELRELIEGALQDVGGRAYLARQAEENPTAFLALLGKILPKEIKADADVKQITRIELVPLGDVLRGLDK